MKKWRWVLLPVVLILLAMGGLYWWARTVIYLAGSKLSKYPGMEQVAEQKGKQYLADPKENGLPIFIEESELSQYPSGFYNLTEIPAQTQLFFAVGRVARWEQIEGSSDQYLMLMHGKKVDRYRVTGETMVAVERVRIPWGQSGQNELEKLAQGKVKDIGEVRIRWMVLPGDAVTVLPVWQLPELSKKDENGVYLVYTLIIRRGIGI